MLKQLLGSAWVPLPASLCRQACCGLILQGQRRRRLWCQLARSPTRCSIDHLSKEKVTENNVAVGISHVFHDLDEQTSTGAGAGASHPCSTQRHTFIDSRHALCSHTWEDLLCV